MLCRVADSLFWMSRYIERAENTVRLVDVTLQTLLESEHTSEEISYSHWKPILSSLDDQALFESLYERRDSHNVTDFLTFSRDNPSSVFSCIAAARENARMIRDQISSEMWETINRLYLFLKRADAEEVCREINFEFYRRIKEFSLLFQGITETTFPHKLGYEFIVCGYQIERADKTCRILDTKRYMDGAPDDGEDRALDAAQWSALLKGCSAFEAYHHEFASDVSAAHVRRFLLLSRDFPRSALYCISRLQHAIHAISRCPITHFSNEAERLTGKLISQLKYATPRDLEGEEAAAMIEMIEAALGDIAVELSNSYMFSKIVDPAAEAESEQRQVQTS